MFNIKEELAKIPPKPGVYIFKDENKNIIYVGKAINLKNRVRQYFQSQTNMNLKTINLVNSICEFEYIVTESEMEALILECNLIKENSPKYNILLKDDKTYPYIKVTINEDFPRVFNTRNVINDKNKYYGPFTDAAAMKETITLIHEIWPLKTCSNLSTKNRRSCLNHHIGRCLAPCIGMVSKEDYDTMIQEVLKFLDGKHNEVIKYLTEKMIVEADKLDFEKAQIYKEKIESVKITAEKQNVANISTDDEDIIAAYHSENEALIMVFFVRHKKMTGNEYYFMDNVKESTKAEILQEFIKQFYSGSVLIPKEIVLETEIEEMDIVSKWLSSIKGTKVSFTVPKKGEKHRLLNLAAKNAHFTFSHFGDKIKRDKERTSGAFEEILNSLGLPKNLKRVEAYDISNTQGVLSVGSLVVFEDGKPKRNAYRKFKIKTVHGANDYASMEEIIKRRFKHGMDEREELTLQGKTFDEGKFSVFPDIIFVDGGQIQVNAGLKALEELNIKIPVCGMVKDDSHRTRGLYYNEKEIILPKHSEGFKLLTRIQDEVHRFAITFHKSLSAKNSLTSILDEIEGIGVKRRISLLKHFGSIMKIKNATVAELMKAEHMNSKSAEKVYNFFNK